ncbi:nitroreductase family protein [Photobacterium phosphoreum]|uniref:nitroreductase family protein n=1 Tax=Photobacterium phosphoreum TaxID=659 RepID=UPI001EFDB2E7|nr:nitroreductase family protein [Photobacterium phosphoreum]
MNGYTENITQLLILTVDRNYFYSIGERNQLYVDGGMFLMNLLYSLHYYKIATCPANWGKTVKEEMKLDKIIDIPDSEKIICIIAIGIAEDTFKVTLSKRRDLEEVYRII